MAEKPMDWADTCERFVAFIDIMGFKDMMFRSDYKDVYSMLSSFHITIEIIEDEAKEVLAEAKKYKRKVKMPLKCSFVRAVSFSDSILLITSDNSLDSAAQILFEVQFILRQAIIKKIPIKGAIAYGKQTADFANSLHFGRPLIDAFELQDELELYGVVLHHTMEKRLNDIDLDGMCKDSDIYKWLVPMKSGKITHYIVDWTMQTENKLNFSNLVSELYNNVSGSPRSYVDNTLDFVHWITKKKAKLEKNK